MAIRTFRIRRVDGTGSHVRGGDAIRFPGAEPLPSLTIVEHHGRGGYVTTPTPAQPDFRWPRRRKPVREEKPERQPRRRRETVPVAVADTVAEAIVMPSAQDRKRWEEEEWLLLDLAPV